MTGWSREYVLHKLTFAQLIRYAEYSVEWQKEQAKLNAIEIGLALGFLKRKDEEETQPLPSPEEEGDGVDELLRRNAKWLTVNR